MRAGGAVRVPYKQIDPPIVPLIRVLNTFPGIHTIGSCGGHAQPSGDQAGEGKWWVLFEVDHTEAGWVSLEFLAWAINRDMGRSSVVMLPDSAPPFLNFPGRMLRFQLSRQVAGDGEKDSPQGLADWLAELKSGYYFTAAAAASWTDDDMRMA